jgi:hypothetical protein
MKIYFANMFGVKGLEKFLRHDINVLVAYPSVSKKEIQKPIYCDSLFLDSGAFGKDRDKIDILEYIDFIKENRDRVDLYANLDVIGNSKKSHKNFKKIESESLNPLPVFHYKSELKWLDRILKYDYIALGGLVPISGNYQLMRVWLDYVWEYIFSKRPDIKVHGFGIQNIDIIKRYPWYSVDASSVHVLARYGGIYTENGTVKINPKVNSKEMKWQISRPLELALVKDHVKTYLDFPYEVAIGQDKDGILSRCAISIHYLTALFENYECQYPSSGIKLEKLF